MGCGCGKKKETQPTDEFAEIKAIIKKKAQALKEHLQSLDRYPTIEEMLLEMPDGVDVDHVKSIKRMQVCMMCDDLNKQDGVCKVCGCFVGAKSQFADEHCPKSKW